MNLKYSSEFKLKILFKFKNSNIKIISKKDKINVNTLKSWYYKIKNDEYNFKDHKKALNHAIAKNITLLTKIRAIHQREAQNWKMFKKINKIRKKNKIPLQMVLKELHISKSTY